MWPLLYPYIEQSSLYDIITTRGFDQEFDSVWFDSLDDPVKEGFGSISILRCPSRRGSGPLLSGANYSTTSSAGVGQVSQYGPVTDYAGILYNIWSNNLHKLYVRGPNNDAAPAGGGGKPCYEGHLGPFRVAAISSNNKVNWSPRDSFAWMADGTSNQLVIGERHIPLDRLGQCHTTVSAAIRPENVDCSYLVAYERAAMAAFRGMYSESHTPKFRPLARPSDFTEKSGSTDDSLGHYAFGSWHPGTCLFVLGDGSVRSISVSTGENILRWAANVKDGNAVTLP